MAQAQARVAELRRGATQAEIDAANAEVTRSQAQLALLEAGQRPESIAASEADLAAAKALLAQAASDLADTELRAPFAREISAVNVKVGEQVPGRRPSNWPTPRPGRWRPRT